jgi:hypothetical protein
MGVPLLEQATLRPLVLPNSVSIGDDQVAPEFEESDSNKPE